MAHPFFTIGHSTRPIHEFVALLREADIELVADVRTVPRSRKNPQFNCDVLPSCGIRHWLRAYCRARRIARSQSGRTIRTERLLGKQKLPQLCRLRDGERFPIGLAQTPTVGPDAELCRDVRGSRMVAMPSPHHCGLPDRGRRDRHPHHWKRANGNCALHRGRHPPARRRGRLPAAGGWRWRGFKSIQGHMTMSRESRIVGYHQDEEQNWVAELSCGHHQHMRHRPPFSERPWVLTESGRAAKIGHPISCAQCAVEGPSRASRK